MRFFIFLLLLSLAIRGTSQTILSGDINARISAIIAAMPGDSGDDYTKPSNNQIDDWKTMVGNVLNGDYVTADGQADALGYELYAFTDNTAGDKLYYLLEEKGSSTSYWGTYIFNPAPCRANLAIQSPHPKKDFNTGKQGVYVFHKLDAKAFMLSGTNRCNHSDASLCSGTTTVCTGGSASYPISDLAHVDTSIWQATTETLLSVVSDVVFVQLHGFTKDVSDPYVIMSNGARNTPAPDYIPLVRDGMLAADMTLTFKIGHIDLAWDRLLGFFNTQGRMINNSADDCMTNAATATGQFIHIEQEKTKLRDDQTGWDKLYSGLANAFSCLILPLELLTFTANVDLNGHVKLQWTTASEVNINAIIVEHSKDGRHFIAIGETVPQGASESINPYNYLDENADVGLHYYRLKITDLDGAQQFSEIIAIRLTATEKPILVSPNPFRDQLTIEVNDPQIRTIQVFDISGKLVQNLEPALDRQYVLVGQSLQKGMYWVVGLDGSGNRVGQVAVVKE